MKERMIVNAPLRPPVAEALDELAGAAGVGREAMAGVLLTEALGLLDRDGLPDRVRRALSDLHYRTLCGVTR